MAILNNTVMATFEIINKSEIVNDSCFNCTPTLRENSRSQLYASAFISVIGIVLNVMICYAIVKEKLLKSSIYIFIFNICISDIITLISLIVNALVAALKSNADTFTIKEATCKISTYILSMSFNVSTLSLMTLAIDRYYIILDNHDFKSPLRGKYRVKVVIGCIWIYALIVNSPQLHLLHITPDVSATCDIYYYSDNYNIPYFIIIFILNYCIPLLIMIVMYTSIIIHLKVAVVDRNLNSSNGADIQVNRKRSISVIKMIVIATVIYMITSFPVPVIMVAAALKRMTITQLRQTIHPVLSSLVTAGLAISIICCLQNPIIYFLFNSTLRKAVIKNCYPCHRRRKCDPDYNVQLIQVSTQQPRLHSLSTL